MRCVVDFPTHPIHASRVCIPGLPYPGRPGIRDIFHSRIPGNEDDTIPGNVRQGELCVTAAERLLFDISAVWEGGTRLRVDYPMHRIHALDCRPMVCTRFFGSVSEMKY